MKWDTYNTKSIKSKYLFRYVSLEKLIHFLKTGSLYLSRMDSFEDNLEGIIPYDITELGALINELPSEEERNKDIPIDIWNQKKEERVFGLRNIQETLKKKQQERYVSCWFLGDSESLGMWDLYATNGFLIRFERLELQNLVKRKLIEQTFLNSMSDLMVAGKVKYQDFDKIPFNENDSLIKYSGFRKHIAFKHEEEYRFILHKSHIVERGIEFRLGKLEDLNFELYANPRMSKFTFKTHEDIIKKYTSTHKLLESNLKPWLEFKNMTF